MRTRFHLRLRRWRRWRQGLHDRLHMVTTMNAHQLNSQGVIINNIDVDSLDVLPNLVAFIGGEIGDSIIDGVLVKQPAPERDIRAEISALESTITPRRLREAVLGTDAGWMATLDAQIAALRAQL